MQSNILIDDEGSPLLADFGQSRFLDYRENVDHDPVIAATDRYMAPERYTEGDTMTPTKAIDVFAFSMAALEVSGPSSEAFKILHQIIVSIHRALAIK